MDKFVIKFTYIQHELGSHLARLELDEPKRTYQCGLCRKHYNSGYEFNQHFITHDSIAK